MFFGGYPGIDGSVPGSTQHSRKQDHTKFYELLEVDKHSSESDIKKAYRRVALKCHPDKGGDAEKFREITRAYEVLSDPVKRKTYDDYGEEGLDGVCGGGADIFAGFFGGGGRAGGGARTCSGGGNIGLSVGGAQDVGSFREKIAAKRMPRLSALTVEGLFSEYYFETGDEWQSVNVEQSALFWPAYSFACSADPLACKPALDDEIWMSVGLNSNIAQQSFQRKNLNLALVIDISGSMRAPLDQRSDAPSKMDLAKESVENLLSELRQEDRLAIVLFDDRSDVLQPLKSLADLDTVELLTKVRAIHPRGTTNMECALREALEQLETVAACSDPSVEENRIVFLTDDKPNRGCTSGMEMLALVRDASRRNIYTSLLGVGVDFDADVIEVMSKAKGAWYGTVKSSEEFQRRLDKEFDYMVTPLVFNVRFELHSEAFLIDRVFGSPEADVATGQIMCVNTLFPSPKDDEGRTKGGVVLVRLLRKGAPMQEARDETIRLRVSWEDRIGVPASNEQLVRPPFAKDVSIENNNFEGPGIRKALLLARYASVMRQWIWDETCNLIDGIPICTNLSRGVFSVPIMKEERTCPGGHLLLATEVGDATSGHSLHTCDRCTRSLSAPECILRCRTCDYDLCRSCYQTPKRSNESRHPKLRLSEPYRCVFEQLKSHVQQESIALGDESILQEVAILETLLKVGARKGH